MVAGSRRRVTGSEPAAHHMLVAAVRGVTCCLDVRPPIAHGGRRRASLLAGMQGSAGKGYENNGSSWVIEVTPAIRDLVVQKGGRQQQRDAFTMGRTESGGQRLQPSNPASFSTISALGEAARGDKRLRFGYLVGLVSLDLLRSAFCALNRGAAPGIDGISWRAYAMGLSDRLGDLLQKVRRGVYRASPYKRIIAAKDNGEQRIIGVSTTEDKVLQRAVLEILGSIYEEEFLDFSYGFRRWRNQHDALEALAGGIARLRISWILESDIEGFFDGVDHARLMELLRMRIADEHLLHLVRQWIEVGFEGAPRRSVSRRGITQGAVISPLLANIYLHHALDMWLETWRAAPGHGVMIAVRYADDVIVGFQHRGEAERFLAALCSRLACYSLRLKPAKTRILAIGLPVGKSRTDRGNASLGRFNFLGFECMVRRMRGGPVVEYRTMDERLSAAMRRVSAECGSHRGQPPSVILEWLEAVERGYLAYHDIQGNDKAVEAFRRHIEGCRGFVPGGPLHWSGLGEICTGAALDNAANGSVPGRSDRRRRELRARASSPVLAWE